MDGDVVAEVAEDLGWKCRVLDLGLLQADDVGAGVLEPVDRGLGAGPDAVDVPGRDTHGRTTSRGVGGPTAVWFYGAASSHQSAARRFGMTVRSTAKAEWHGSLKEGKGDMHLARGNYSGEFTFASRFETGKGTNPEELLAAAHAGCFSMQLS